MQDTSYYHKYDQNNIGTSFVFGKTYDELKEKNITGPAIACPGKGVERYINYFRKIRTEKAWFGYFFELDKKIFEYIQSVVVIEQWRHNIRVLRENIFTYDDSPQWNHRAVRIEDLSIGCCITNLAPFAAGRLLRQKNNSTPYYPRAHILAASIRRVSSKTIVDSLQYYLKSIGLKIKRVNGINVTSGGNYDKCFIQSNGKILKEYWDDLRCSKGRVVEHQIELEENNLCAEMKAHVYRNGSHMIQTVLTYRY